MEAKEYQRQEYAKQILDTPKEDLVFVDESGIDRASYKNRGWGKKGKVLLSKTSEKMHYPSQHTDLVSIL